MRGGKFVFRPCFRFIFIKREGEKIKQMKQSGRRRAFNAPYEGANLDRIAFPVGGMGAGMFTLQGQGSLGSFSMCNRPDIDNEPNVFAAVHLHTAGVTRLLEGQLPKHKTYTGGLGPRFASHGNGLSGRNYGLPRFSECSFTARFPFARVELRDSGLPVQADVEGFSPFVPGDAFNASLPFGSLAYTLKNVSETVQDGVFYFNAYNFIKKDDSVKTRVERLRNGFEFCQEAEPQSPDQFWFDVFTDGSAHVDTAWYRGNWFDALPALWNVMSAGESADKTHTGDRQSGGGTISVPFSLRPDEQRTIRIYITWYAPFSDLRVAPETDGPAETYRPWYSAQFASVREVNEYVLQHFAELYKQSRAFSDCLFSSDLPPEVLEAVSANLSILKSPTVLRCTDGRIWGWEGCFDDYGYCPGTCTHVWNYAQALCNLFPELERGLRQTEFFDSQDERGHQDFRASLPIGPTEHTFYAAADGQLGGDPQSVPGMADKRRYGMDALSVVTGGIEPEVLYRNLGSVAQRRTERTPPQYVRYRILGGGYNVYVVLFGSVTRRGGHGGRIGFAGRRIPFAV